MFGVWGEESLRREALWPRPGSLVSFSGLERGRMGALAGSYSRERRLREFLSSYLPWNSAVLLDALNSPSAE